MARYKYAQEKLYVARRCLATGQGDVRARIHGLLTSVHAVSVVFVDHEAVFDVGTTHEAVESRALLKIG